MPLSHTISVFRRKNSNTADSSRPTLAFLDIKGIHLKKTNWGKFEESYEEEYYDLKEFCDKTMESQRRNEENFEKN